MLNISIKEVFRYGWQTFKLGKQFWGQVIVIYLGITFAPFLFRGIQSAFWQLAISGVFIVIGTVISMGVIKISLSFCDGTDRSLSDLFTLARLFLRYIVASILYMVIVLGGLILLIVPGFIWGVRFSYYDYFIVDREMGPIEALRHSYRLTSGNAKMLFKFIILVYLIDIAGFVCLLVGMFVSIPVTMLARAYVFRKLQEGR